MEKFDELLEKLNSTTILQTRGDWAEDIPEDIWNEYFKGNFKHIAANLEPEESRWFEVSTTVIEIFGRLLGITYVSNLFSENMSYADCFVDLSFLEMKEVMIKSYEPK